MLKFRRESVNTFEDATLEVLNFDFQILVEMVKNFMDGIKGLYMSMTVTVFVRQFNNHDGNICAA